MKPVFQLVIDGEKGDCMRACMASILELLLEDVPDFKLISLNDMSWSINQWLATRGLAFLNLPWLAPDCAVWHIDGYCILSMPSQKFKDKTHAVVGRLKVIDQKNWRWDIAHDPNPGNEPYDRQVEPRRIYLLVHTGLPVES